MQCRRLKNVMNLLKSLKKMGGCGLKKDSNLGQSLVGLVPLAGVDQITHGREQVALVARPQLGAEHDVFELLAVGNLPNVSGR